MLSLLIFAFSVHIPDALATDCSKCTAKQQESIKKVLKHLIEKERPLYDLLEAKYDPDHVYKKRYEALRKEEGIVL